MKAVPDDHRRSLPRPTDPLSRALRPSDRHVAIRRRPGLTLLEVLISMFVLSVGLMGLAALIPVGKQQIQKGSQYDRSAACGRAGLNELLVRDYLNPDMWMSHLGNSFGPTNAFFPIYPYTSPAAWIDWDAWNASGASPTPIFTNAALGQVDPSPISLGNSICIDPLFVARNFLDGNAGHQNGRATFPFYLDQGNPSAGSVQEPDADGDLSTGPVPPRMQRITVRAWPKTVNVGQAPPPMIRDLSIPAPGLARDALADRIFTWHDETQFDLPANVARRPTPVVMTTPTGGGIRAQSAAEYSWFATLTPRNPSPTPLDGSPIDYRVSVVVVFKRDLSWVLRGDIDQAPGQRPTPKERMVCCELLGGGLGGGPVRLWLPVRSGAANNNPAAPDRSDMPRVRPGQWIMLSAWRPARNVTPLTAVADFRWYRVAAADNDLVYQNGATVTPPAGVQGRWYQEVTLQGADWNEQECLDPDGDGRTAWPVTGGTASYPPTFATIVEGVVGVYETNWTWHP